MNIPQHLTSNNDRLAFYRDFFARMEALPGVVSVGGTTRVPLGSTSVSTTVQIEGRPRAGRGIAGSAVPPRDAQLLRSDGHPDSPRPELRYERRRTAPPVAVINETMARKLFANQDPIGQHVRTGPNPSGAWTTIVGVIGDVRHGGLEEVPQPEMYISYLQGPPVSPFIVLRTTSDPAQMAETVRAEARRIDKNLPIYDMRTMSTLRSEAVSTRRFVLLIVGAFGALALGPCGDRRLRRDVADRQRADARSRRAARARRGAVAAAADDRRPGGNSSPASASSSAWSSR